MKKIAINQTIYLPWKGYFDLINSVDVFVFLDTVQYTEHDWRNRNKILTHQGSKWITVPIKNSCRRGQLICEAEIDNRSTWQRKHYNAFKLNYSKAPYFNEFEWIIEELFMNKSWNKISEFNISAIKLIAKILGIKTEFIDSLDLNPEGAKDDRVIDIIKKLNGDYYLSGPRASEYLIPEKFENNNIKLEYINYDYPDYKQVFEPFDHFVTVLDLIFNCGEAAPYYIWGWRN